MMCTRPSSTREKGLTAGAGLPRPRVAPRTAPGAAPLFNAPVGAPCDAVPRRPGPAEPRPRATPRPRGAPRSPGAAPRVAGFAAASCAAEMFRRLVAARANPSASRAMPRCRRRYVSLIPPRRRVKRSVRFNRAGLLSTSMAAFNHQVPSAFLLSKESPRLFARGSGRSSALSSSRPKLKVRVLLSLLHPGPSSRCGCAVERIGLCPT
jgi:hypothetical protein